MAVPLQPGEMHCKSPKFFVLVRRAGIVQDEALEAAVVVLHLDPPRQESSDLIHIGSLERDGRERSRTGVRRVASELFAGDGMIWNVGSRRRWRPS
jgi:hypothetical protein